MRKTISDEELMEQALSKQIPEAPDNNVASKEADEDGAVTDETSEPEQKSESWVGKKLTKMPGAGRYKEADAELVASKRLTKVGEKIGSAGYADGWIDVDRSLLGDRSVFYPESWQFRIRPATVDAIRNWSTIDDTNPNSIDDTFNEIIKSCVSIITPEGLIPWGNINSWDRFFFLLLVREYTFAHGETKIQYEEECPECGNPVTFELKAETLMYDLPDTEVMPMYDPDTRAWTIDPEEYELDADPITLYLPTLDKDANIKAWIISHLQENSKRKIDQVFIKFLTWMAPKISKDSTIAKRQIREYELTFRGMDEDMFSFVNDVIKNIAVTPETKLTMQCPVCGEEVTSDIQFPNSIGSLFNVPNRHKKFGSK